MRVRMVCRGHGTYVQDDKVLASVAGTLERVNKLVSVRPLRTKYVAALRFPSQAGLSSSPSQADCWPALLLPDTVQKLVTSSSGASSR